ncbi:MAG: transcriptional regulator, TetR family [Clostridia bacterium]|jgi:AcrR family transcriptional regulator|nr:transcriptional regulator, TetR family [Clostridia bacterium]
MDNEVLDTKSRILQEAIAIVGLKGEFTIREVAEKAGVNVASINYYFGNKNNLLKEVENYYSDILYKTQLEILQDDSLSSEDKLKGWAKSLIGFMFESPALIGLIVNIVNEDKSYKPILVQKIYLNSELQDIIQDIIKDGTGITEEKVLKFKYLQFFSGILGPVISRTVANTFGEGKGVFNINSLEDLSEYIEILISGVLTK